MQVFLKLSFTVHIADVFLSLFCIMVFFFAFYVIGYFQISCYPCEGDQNTSSQNMPFGIRIIFSRRQLRSSRFMKSPLSSAFCWKEGYKFFFEDVTHLFSHTRRGPLSQPNHHYHWRQKVDTTLGLHKHNLLKYSLISLISPYIYHLTFYHL